ncbi:MAG: glycosyltransferase family 4 protein [Actinomycetota bacterium]|nr:glycosyltransferase family 4 protein [Actinomycetota bacterium]
MKILLVSQEYPPETGWGGIGTYTWMLGHGLAGIGHEVHVLSVAPGVGASDKTIDGIEVHRRPLLQPRAVGSLTGLVYTYEFLSLSFSVWRGFKELQQAHGFDVVEFPNWKAEGYFFLRHKPIPSAMRLHSMSFQLFPNMSVGPRDAKWASALETFTVNKIDVCHAPETHLAMVSERLGIDRSKTAVIPAPVAIPQDPGPPPAGAPRIVFAGRFEPRKNPESIIRAVPAVVKRFPAARFVFVGRDTAAGGHDSYEDWLKSLAGDLGVASSIEFVDGWQDDAVSQQMPKATIVVVPSRSESFGYVAAEGSSYARPVIASKVNGLSSIVQPGVTGYLVEPEDIDGWSARLIELLADPGRASQMGIDARAWVESNLAPRRIAEKMTEAYELAIRLHHGAAMKVQ